MSTYRVRQLQTVGQGVVDRTYQGRGAAGAFMAASDRAGAVFEVTASEVRLSADDILAMLRDGRLRSTDLVFTDGTWGAFTDCVYFEDGAEVAARRERWRRNLPYAAVVLGFTGFGLLVALLQAVASYGR
jgi:hypothetical protein